MTKRTTRSATLRESTPPSVNTMTVSEFVRGGIYNLTAPTVIVSHGTEVGTWHPRGQAAGSAYYASSTTTFDAHAGTPPTNTTLLASSAPPGSPVVSGIPIDVDALNKSIEKLHKYLSRLPEAAEEEKDNG